MFRGNALARIDDKGRLKLPSQFRSLVTEHFGSEMFVTSIFGDCAHIYPLPSWIQVEARLDKAPSTHPGVRQYRYRVNYFGQATTMDAQGRVLIQPLLRDQARMNGDVVVIGLGAYLEVWNRTMFKEQILASDFQQEHLQGLSQYGI